MQKTYVLDTNVLLNDPNSIYSFDDNVLIIPLAVLEELDRFKNKPDEIGCNARQVCRSLDEMRVNGDSLIEGVELPNGGLLKVVAIDKKALQHVPAELSAEKVDNQIIAFMLYLKAFYACSVGVDDAILVSKDINVRIKCDSLGIRCNDYLKMRVASDAQSLYTGVQVIEMPEALIDAFYYSKSLVVPPTISCDRKFYPNQIVVIKAVGAQGETLKSAITKVVIQKGVPVLTEIAKIEQAFGLKPRNKEQSFSLDLLFDPNIKLVTLAGKSGCGKTLLSIAAGLEQLRGVGSKKLYDKLIVTRPVQPVGNDIGFLPGTMEEKMAPWISPINDNLDCLVNNGNKAKKKAAFDEHGKPQQDSGQYLALLKARGLIEVEAITFIRGRSIPNAFIIVDECQNISMHELKTIVTRAGEGTKIVLTGDIEQIDNTHVDTYTNGLTYAIEKFKEYDIAGHVSLIKGERSALATLASQIL